MIASQAKKKFGIEGTKRLRKQWTKALLHGKTPNNSVRMPNYNPDRIKLTKEERILLKIKTKVVRMAA